MSAVTSPSSPRSGLSSDDLVGFDGADELSQAWRGGLLPDPALTVSEWADRHRLLSPRASAEPGRYRTDRTPYIREIVDALSPMNPTRRVVVMKSAQVGFTEGGNNWIGYAIH
jgi:phage terminase large subunit GpA-like protein